MALWVTNITSINVICSVILWAASNSQDLFQMKHGLIICLKTMDRFFLLPSSPFFPTPLWITNKHQVPSEIWKKGCTPLKGISENQVNWMLPSRSAKGNKWLLLFLPETLQSRVVICTPEGINMKQLQQNMPRWNPQSGLWVERQEFFLSSAEVVSLLFIKPKEAFPLCSKTPWFHLFQEVVVID